MDKFDRIQQLHRLLATHRNPVPLSTLSERMECSGRTVKRTIETMQLYLDAPIEYDRAANGWHYADTPENRFELPGLWLTGEELQSLILLLEVLENLGNGLLNDEIGVIEKEVAKLLRARKIKPSAFTDHIKVLPIAHKPLPGKIFHKISEALLQNHRVGISYVSYNGIKTTRDVSPQTLVYYRENWYLDAWCHLRDDLRTFSIARVVNAEILGTHAERLDRAVLEAHFATSYGIFAGEPKYTARLRFLPAIAREIAQQQWHPDQQGAWEGEDYLLAIPYSDHTELANDIMAHIPNVEALQPEALRNAIRERLHKGLTMHDEKS